MFWFYSTLMERKYLGRDTHKPNTRFNSQGRAHKQLKEVTEKAPIRDNSYDSLAQHVVEENNSGKRTNKNSEAQGNPKVT